MLISMFIKYFYFIFVHHSHLDGSEMIHVKRIANCPICLSCRVTRIHSAPGQCAHVRRHLQLAILWPIILRQIEFFIHPRKA